MNPIDTHRSIRSENTTALHEIARTIIAPISALLFWSAIILPVIYLSLLVTGISTTQGLLQFLGLVGLHLVALLGGRAHRHAPE